jgi:hypothetical protein
MTGPYDSVHQAIRKAMLSVATPADPCARCGGPIGPDPSKIDLGHTDDRTAYSGLECARCNRSAGGKLGNARKRQRRERAAGAAVDLEQVAVAVEISTDRQHTSVVTAGYLPDDLVLLTLAGYLDGTDPVGKVLELHDHQVVIATIVDPHSPAATSIAPLEAARVKVTCPTSSDLVIAHGNFLDTLRAGRLRHSGQAVLTAGMRALEARRLGGADAPERRGALADVAPGVAGMLACWGLERAPRPPEPFHLVGG